MEADSPAGAAEVITKYRTVINATVDISMGGKSICIVDPYHESRGPMHLQQRGKYLLGIFNNNPLVYEPLLQGIAEHIPSEE